MTILKATAEYTGGGIYIFVGSFTDKTHFFFSSEDESILVVNEYPDLEDENIYYEEWQNAHEIGYLYGEQAEETAYDILTWIIDNKPEGNYNEFDLEALRGE